MLKGKLTMKETFNSHKSFCLFLCVLSLSFGKESTSTLLALLENSLGLDQLLTFKSLILT